MVNGSNSRSIGAQCEPRVFKSSSTMNGAGEFHARGEMVAKHRFFSSQEFQVQTDQDTDSKKSGRSGNSFLSLPR